MVHVKVRVSIGFASFVTVSSMVLPPQEASAHVLPKYGAVTLSPAARANDSTPAVPVTVTVTVPLVLFGFPSATVDVPPGGAVRSQEPLRNPSVKVTTPPVPGGTMLKFETEKETHPVASVCA